MPVTAAYVWYCGMPMVWVWGWKEEKKMNKGSVNMMKFLLYLSHVYMMVTALGSDLSAKLWLDVSTEYRGPGAIQV